MICKGHPVVGCPFAFHNGDGGELVEANLPCPAGATVVSNGRMVMRPYDWLWRRGIICNTT